MRPYKIMTLCLNIIYRLAS